MKTHSSIDQTACEQIAQSLSQVLANTYILYVKTQNFHWNVIDPRFHSLHEMFEQQYKELSEEIDELAERIRMVKNKAPGSLRQFLEMGTLEESDGNLSANEMIYHLLHDREVISNQIRPKIEEAQKLGDEGTADLFIQQLRAHEKAAWMLRSHLTDQN